MKIWSLVSSCYDFQKHEDPSAPLHRRTLASALQKQHDKPVHALVEPWVSFEGRIGESDYSFQGMSWKSQSRSCPQERAAAPLEERNEVSWHSLNYVHFLFIYYMPGIMHSIMSPMVTRNRWAVLLWMDASRKLPKPLDPSEHSQQTSDTPQTLMSIRLALHFCCCCFYLYVCLFCFFFLCVSEHMHTHAIVYKLGVRGQLVQIHLLFLLCEA